jgi:ABC-type nitrate/sulfonate/bicarbonate transport system ATPase subunit
MPSLARLFLSYLVAALSASGRIVFLVVGVEPEHSSRIFGRGGPIERLMDEVQRQPFVAVVGASGSGKSSLADLPAVWICGYGEPEAVTVALSRSDRRDANTIPRS